MTELTAQPGILAPLSSHGRALTFRLRAEITPAQVSEALRGLRDVFRSHWGVLGLGLPLVTLLPGQVPDLRAFPALTGPGCSVPSTQQAVWLMLLGEDRGDLFDHAEQAKARMAPAFELDEVLETFLYAGGRDLTGYEDGTENPTGGAAVETALVIEGAGLAGSSFVAVQRWVHDLARFRHHTPGEQDHIIGRQRESNEELDDAPESAHVKRTAQEDFTPEAFMLRRSMPWTDANGQGLLFVAYGHSLQAYEQVLQRMVGAEDSIVDALFSFSRPVTGGYYWCPPLHDGHLDLSLLGV